MASTLTSVSLLESGAWQLQQNCTLEERAAPMCCCFALPLLSLPFSGRQKALHDGCGITRNTLATGARDGAGAVAGTGCGCAEIAQFAAIIIFTAHCVDVASSSRGYRWVDRGVAGAGVGEGKRGM